MWPQISQMEKAREKPETLTNVAEPEIETGRQKR
jgi:hypothetical protein